MSPGGVQECRKGERVESNEKMRRQKCGSVADVGVSNDIFIMTVANSKRLKRVPFNFVDQ